MKDLREKIVKILENESFVVAESVCGGKVIGITRSDYFRIATGIISILPPTLGEEEITMVIMDVFARQQSSNLLFCVDIKSLAHALANRIPKPKPKEWCECVEYEHTKEIKDGICQRCHKPVKLPAPKPQIEELILEIKWIWDNKLVIDKINEIIRVVNSGGKK